MTFGPTGQASRFATLLAGPADARRLAAIWATLRDHVTAETARFCETRLADMLVADDEPGQRVARELAYTAGKFTGPHDDALDCEMTARGRRFVANGGDEEDFIAGLLANYDSRYGVLERAYAGDPVELARVTRLFYGLATVEIRAFAAGAAEFRAGREQRLHADLASMMESIDRSNLRVDFSPDGLILGANDNFLAAMGYGRAELVGQHHRLLCAPDFHQSAAYAEFWRVLRRGEFSRGEYQRQHRDGTEVWLQASYNPVFDGDGRIARIVKLATDVTEVRRREQQEAARVRALQREAEGRRAALEATVAEVEELVDTIRAITARTKLLALNAKIEAARAGEAGLGFGVVAQEVGALSDNTRRAADRAATLLTRKVA